MRLAPAAPFSLRGALAASSAAKAGTGAISGKVTGHGKPLKNICVVAISSRGGGPIAGRTPVSGRYRLGGLRPGRYIVHFAPCSAKSNWLPQWYPNITTIYLRHRPPTVTVTAGKTTRGIDAALKLGGEIDGTVRSQAGRALAGICVLVFGRHNGRVIYGREVSSAANGQYSAHALFPGTYEVGFSRGCRNSGNYAPQWWRNAASQAHATKIPVNGGQVVTKIDAAMPKGAAVTGIVRGASPTGPRLGGICVFARSRTRGSPFAAAMTARNGSYKLVGLTTGRYQISYTRCRNRGNYLPAKRSVQLTLGRTVSGFDAVLPAGAAISGTVTDSHGNPVAGICVQVRGQRGHSGGAKSASDGSYSVDALPTGSYTVHFTGGCGNAGSYAPQYYHGQANLASASPVQLTAGQTTSGIDAAMQPGATITGVVADRASNKLSNVCVGIAAVPGVAIGFSYNAITFTKAGGTYTAVNLAPGLYAVDFGCFFGTAKFASQWFKSKPDAGSANLVSAPAGTVTSGISAALRPGGTITGVVTNRAGQPLRGICVEAGRQGSFQSAVLVGGAAITGKKGTYQLRRLAPGRYVIVYHDCSRSGYGSRWYHQKATSESATPVTVTAGGTTAGIDEALAPGGSISGRVATRAGTPLAGACVEAVDATTQSVGIAGSDRTGRYSITGLSTGSYQVTFFPCQARSKLASFTRPAPVPVTAPAAVTGISARLAAAGSISGTVLGTAAATPQAGVCVVAIPLNPTDSYGYALTGKHGNYDLRGLGAGKYQVYVGDPFCFNPFAGADYAPQWYNDQPTQATAAKVTVAAGTATTGIGATLALDGGISGTVTDASHAPVAGECVTADPVDATPDPLAGQTLHPAIAVTGSDGSYSLVDLPPGKYTVEFSTGCGDSGYATQWWQDATSASSATAVAVPATTTVTGIDATLQP